MMWKDNDDTEGGMKMKKGERGRESKIVRDTGRRTERQIKTEKQGERQGKGERVRGRQGENQKECGKKKGGQGVWKKGETEKKRE